MMNLSKALQPYNLADVADITITPDVFSVKVIEMNRGSQQFNARVSDFSKLQPEHSVFKGDASLTFWTDIQKGAVTPETLSILVNVLIVDWSLKDDDGKPVEFTPETAMEIFTGFSRVANKLLLAVQQPSFFTREWPQDALKN